MKDVGKAIHRGGRLKHKTRHAYKYAKRRKRTTSPPRDDDGRIWGGGGGASFLFNCAQPSSWFVHSASATQFSSSFSDILRPDGPSCRHTRFYFSPNDVVVPLFSLIHFLSTREKIKKRKSPAYGTTPKMDADHLGGSIQSPSSYFFLIFQKVFSSFDINV
jgi:hypothetical protein